MAPVPAAGVARKRRAAAAQVSAAPPPKRSRFPAGVVAGPGSSTGTSAAAAEAVCSVVAAIKSGRTLTKMEVFRLAMQKTGQGDEAISTGTRTVYGAALKRLAADGGPGWHRVVSADGSFWAEHRGQTKRQLAMLRAEGARPREGESMGEWARRVRAPFVGCYKPLRGDRRYARTNSTEDATALAKMDPERVEPLNAAQLWRRMELSGGKHFRHLQEAKPRPPAFTCAELSQKDVELAAGTSAAIASRVAAAFKSSSVGPLFTTGAVCLKGLLGGREVALLKAFAAVAKFSEVISLEGEAGFCGRYCFCPERQPVLLGHLRRALFAGLMQLLPHLQGRYGRNLRELEERCRTAGQARTANIFLAYGEGAVNLAHQDPYGDLFFPYQAMIMLSKRGQDFNGGDFFVKNLTTKEALEVPADAGDLTLFAANEKAEGGANFKHGVRKVTAGSGGCCQRFSVGLVFNLRK